MTQNFVTFPISIWPIWKAKFFFGYLQWFLGFRRGLWRTPSPTTNRIFSTTPQIGLDGILHNIQKNLSIFYRHRRWIWSSWNMAPIKGNNPGSLSIWWLVRWKKMAWLWCRNKVYNQQFLIQSLFQICAKHVMHFQQAIYKNDFINE